MYLTNKRRLFIWSTRRLTCLSRRRCKDLYSMTSACLLKWDTCQVMALDSARVLDVFAWGAVTDVVKSGENLWLSDLFRTSSVMVRIFKGLEWALSRAEMRRIPQELIMVSSASALLVDYGSIDILTCVSAMMIRYKSTKDVIVLHGGSDRRCTDISIHECRWP